MGRLNGVVHLDRLLKVHPYGILERMDNAFVRELNSTQSEVTLTDGE